jgi:hypothetical protein
MMRASIVAALSGLVCALDGVCRTRVEVEESFVITSDVEVITVDSEVAGEAEVGDVAGCTPVSGAFEAATAPCPAAPEVRVVKNLQLATEGHGLAQLAGVANQVLDNAYESGEAKLELRIDGSLDAGCTNILAWVRDERDVGADCVPLHTGTMPFEVPNLVEGVVEAAVFDQSTNLVHGRVDKETLIASLAPELQSVAQNLITEDVDIDGDSVPDRASVILELTF